MKENNIIADKSFQFAIRIVNLYKYLSGKKRELQLSKQILKSGTAVGANVEEAIGARTRKEFVNILTTAYKEARETKYWLRLLNKCGYIDEKSFDSVFKDCEELCKILGSIIKTTKQTL